MHVHAFCLQLLRHPLQPADLFLYIAVFPHAVEGGAQLCDLLLAPAQLVYDLPDDFGPLLVGGCDL